MDVGTSRSALGRKTRKLFAGQNASQDKDVISRLPDEILVRILSFLSTNEAIKTSVLSTRWKYLWMSIPSFSFFEHSFNWSETKGASFLDSIDRALLLRNSSCLGDFHLLLTRHVDASRLHSWLSTAIRREVQNLFLYLHNLREFVLPTSLFTSRSLSYLFLGVSCTLKVPSFVCFSGLKNLQLANVVFQDDQSAQRLFSGCPLLEYLTLHKCHWKYIKEITIEIPSLRSLTFYGSRFSPDRYFNGKIIISALNLETLVVRSFLTVELFTSNLLSLSSAKIDTYRWNGRQKYISRIATLLSGLHNVRSLYVSSETLEPLLYTENYEELLLPTFHNLTEFHGFAEHPLANNNYACSALLYILQKSPNLEVLDLPRGFDEDGLCIVLATVPQCFQTSLKRFILYNADVRYDQDDLSLLKHVVESAPFLERVTINCSPNLSENLEKQEEICQQLRQLRGGADSCLIEVFPYKDLSSS